MDIIANHTADVIKYSDGDANGYKYKSRADFPYSRRASDGAAINPGFEGDKVQTPENFAKLTDTNYAYTVNIPKGEEKVKVPAWLNDPINYHNRGDTTFTNENSTMGDFVGLDDLMTESPRVVQGMIDIYGDWIDRFGIDGFRIDTAKHVNVEFWLKFLPAMEARAKARGIPNFHIFGEVMNEGDVALQARFMREAKMESVLDFNFGRSVVDVVAGQRGTDAIARVLDDDALYEGGKDTAKQLPTFLGNHDVGRFSMFMRNANPKASDEELLRRVILGHAMILTSRGVPTFYSGDEQGFISDGNDQAAREDMFASKVASYNDNRLLGTEGTTAQSNFDTGHPLYRFFAKFSGLRRTHEALRRGRTVVRNYSDKPGLFAYSRIHAGQEVLVIFNTSNAPLSANVELDVKSTALTSLHGQCPTAMRAPGTIAVKLPALDFMVCSVR